MAAHRKRRPVSDLSAPPRQDASRKRARSAKLLGSTEAPHLRARAWGAPKARPRVAGRVVKPGEGTIANPRQGAERDVDGMGAVAPRALPGPSVAAQVPIAAGGGTQVQRVPVRRGEAGRSPGVHPRRDLIDRVPAEDRAQRRDLLVALPAVELRCAAHVSRRAPLAYHAAPGCRHRQVRSRDAQPGIRQQLGLDRREHFAVEANVGVQLGDHVPVLGNLLHRRTEGLQLGGGRESVARAWTPRPAQQDRRWVRGGELGRDLSRAVAGAVINQHREIRSTGLRRKRGERHRQVLGLVEEAHNDRDRRPHGRLRRRQVCRCGLHQ